MLQRYYFSYRSDNYMLVVAFTTRYAAKRFTEERRKEYKDHSYIKWNFFSRVTTREKAIAMASYGGKIYTDWQSAAKKCISHSL